MISLHPLDRADGGRVAHIATRADQLAFAGTVADALAEPPERFDLHEMRWNNRAAGIFKIDRHYHSDFPFAATDELGLRAVMIDAALQGQGIGSAAMAALRDYLPWHYPDAAAVVLTVNIVNLPAVAAYRKAGFVDTGDIWPHGKIGPQHIMRLTLR